MARGPLPALALALALLPLACAASQLAPASVTVAPAGTPASPVASARAPAGDLFVLSALDGGVSLARVSAARALVWAVDVAWPAGLGDTPRAYDVCLGRDAAFVVATSTYARVAQGVVLAVDGVFGGAAPAGAPRARVARSDALATELRACVVVEEGGAEYVYATGGTRGRLYGERESADGVSEVVVVKLDAALEVVNATQRGLGDVVDADDAVHGVGLAVRSVRGKDDKVVVAVQVSSLVSSQNTAAVLELPLDLSAAPAVAPAMLGNYGNIHAEALDVSRRVLDEGYTSYVFVAGRARVSPARRFDVLAFFSGEAGDERSTTPIYADGANMTKLDDFGVSVKGGPDGNAYFGGYSTIEAVGRAPQNVPFVIVMSPTGKRLQSHLLDIPDNQSITTVDMEVFGDNDGATTVLLIGLDKVTSGNTTTQRVAVAGVVVANGSVPVFDGTGTVVIPENTAGGSTDATDNSVGTGVQARSMLPVYLAGGVGGLLVLVAIVAGVVVVSKARSSTARRSADLAEGSANVAPSALV